MSIKSPDRQAYRHTPRIIKNLAWARLTDHGFPVTPLSDLPKAMQRGKRFEAAALKRLCDEFWARGAACYPLQWIEFVDSNGSGLAQPDWFHIRKDGVLVLVECKYTQHHDADKAMKKLYAPLLRRIFEPKKVVRVQVVKKVGIGSNHMVAIEDLYKIRNEKVEHLLYLPEL